MISRALIVFCTICLGNAMAEEYFNPMQPPALALQKFRIEKLKKMPPQANKRKPAKSAVSWELNSILFSDERQHAIINNKLARKGDTVDGARLVVLEPDHVRLISDGKAIELSLPGRKAAIKKSLSEK